MDGNRPLGGEPLENPEPFQEPLIGPQQRRARMDPQFPRQIHHREQQIADLLLPTGRSELRLDLGQLLSHLLRRSGRVGPVETDPGGALLETEGHQQLGKGGRKSVEQPARVSSGAAFPELELLPPLLLALLEKMGMTPLHFGFEPVGDFVGGEVARFLTQHELPGKVEHQVGDFVPDGGSIAAADRLVELVDFFHQIGPQGLAGLDLVPGAPDSEIPHHRHRARQRRIRLHCSSRSDKLPAPVTKVMREISGRAWLDVDLDALVRNARRFAERAGGPLLPMVKANGYGLGAIPVTRALETVDPWGYGVATLEEGAELREAGIARPVLVFTPFIGGPDQVAHYRQHDLRAVIGDRAALETWLSGRGGPFHVEIDTGMSRAGFLWRDEPELAGLGKILASAGGWEGVFTHFHSPDADPESVADQVGRFERALAAFPRRPPLVHTSNSAAIGLPDPPIGDLSRPGIFLYGGEPAGDLVPEPVARLSARIVSVRRLLPGDTVSYGAEWKAAAPTTIATLSIGYADGVLRSLGGRGLVEINDRLVPMVGRVNMDMVMVDAGDAPVRVGDVGSIFGGRVAVADQARRGGTNAYELLTAIGPRVARRYRGGGGG